MAKVTTIAHRVTMVDVRRGSSPAVERIRGRQLQKIAMRIAQRDEYTCQVCGRVTVDGEVDHLTPLHLGGAESDENRQWLCLECHAAKTEREERGRGGSDLPGS